MNINLMTAFNKFTTKRFFYGALMEGTNIHYCVWGIVPVTEDGKHVQPIRNNPHFIFNSRSKAKQFIMKELEKEYVETEL